MKQIKDLIDLITLDKVGENIFKGENFQTPWGRVFGGQVLAQSLNAAYQTVPDDRHAHAARHARLVHRQRRALPQLRRLSVRGEGSAREGERARSG